MIIQLISNKSVMITVMRIVSIALKPSKISVKNAMKNRIEN